MSVDRIQRAMSADGTQIAGRVLGQGPPLVLVHGGVGDGETSWRFLVPLLSEHFTCYTMSLRGRGLSAENPDHSVDRLEQDITAFVESIGEPVVLVGHSSGGALSLGAAARAAGVSAVVVYEPALPELSEDIRARYEGAFARMGAAAAEGRLVDAARIALEDCALANDEELAIMAAAGVPELVAPNVPSHLRDEGLLSHRFADPSRLGRLTMPILLLRGSRTHPFYADVVRHLADRLDDPHLRGIDGAGHMGPQLAADAVADELGRFLATRDAAV